MNEAALRQEEQFERFLAGREKRRFAADARAEIRLDRKLAEQERREARATAMIGQLCREGQTVHYVFPAGGKYREGTVADLLKYLFRRYV